MNDCLVVAALPIRMPSNKELRTNLKNNLPTACNSAKFFWSVIIIIIIIIITFVWIADYLNVDFFFR